MQPLTEEKAKGMTFMENDLIIQTNIKKPTPGMKKTELEKMLAAEGFSYEDFRMLRHQLRDDPRKGIQELFAKEERRYNALLALQKEYEKRCSYENKLYQSQFTTIAGIDEVGRGPLAGPVYAGAVILSREKQILGIRDSKKLSAKKREELSKEIIENCIAYGIGTASETEIDEINILNATKLAMKRAVEALSIKPQFLLLDALELPEIKLPQFSMIKGDDLSVSIGAASIVAKVARDHFMEEMSERFPEYGFHENKGYGTQQHIDAIRKFGICKLHRKSFVKNFL